MTFQSILFASYFHSNLSTYIYHFSLCICQQ